MRDDGGGGSGNALLGKFYEMLSLMADRSIDEMPTGEFAENSEDAFYRTVELQGLLHGDREEVTGGYKINVTSTTQGVDNQTWYVLTREAPEWSSNRSKYEGELETLRTCIADLESWQHGPPISNMEWVYEALYQREFLEGDDFTDLKKEHPEIVESVGDEVPVWENIEQMGSDTSSWDGQFIKALADIYLLQLPHILMGQMAVTGYLLGSLQMSEAAVKAAEDNIGKVLDGTIAALEEAGAGLDISLSEVLDVVSKATGLASAVLALVPGGQGVSAGLALTSVVTGLGGELAGKIEGKPDAKETEMKISGDTVDEIADSLEKEIKKCLNQVAAVENGCADMIAELSAVMDQTNVVNGNIHTATVALTSQDCYFRPKPVTGGEGNQHLAGESSTATLAVDDVNVLALMGAKTFPAMATEYRSMNEDLAGAKDSFLTEALVRKTIGEKSTLYGKWVEAHGKLEKLFTESATNLDDVGGVVVEAALDIEGTDQAAGTKIDKATHDLIDK